MKLSNLPIWPELEPSPKPELSPSLLACLKIKADIAEYHRLKRESYILNQQIANNNIGDWLDINSFIQHIQQVNNRMLELRRKYPNACA